MVQKLYQKDQLKFIALPNFFIHVFSIGVSITLVEHFSLFIEKDYLIMLLVCRRVMQNLCSHCRWQGALPWNVPLFQADFGGKRESKTHGKSCWGRKVSSRSIFRVCAFSIQRTRLSQSLEWATILCVCVSDPIKCFIPFLCYRSKFSVDGLIASSLHNWLSFDQVKSCQWTIIISQQYWFSEVAVRFMLNHCCFHFMCIPCRQIQYLFTN